MIRAVVGAALLSLAFGLLVGISVWRFRHEAWTDVQAFKATWPVALAALAAGCGAFAIAARKER